MASLALMVTFILGFLILSGPIVYGISFIKFIPNMIIWCIASPVFVIGLIWTINMVTIWPMNFLGCVPMLFCWLAIKRRLPR